MSLFNKRIRCREYVQHELGDGLGTKTFLFCSVTFGRNSSGLDRHRNSERYYEQQESCACSDTETVSAHESLRVVDPVALSRENRLARKITSHICGERFDRGI